MKTIKYAFVWGGLDCESDYRKMPSERSLVMSTRSEHVDCEEEVVRQTEQSQDDRGLQ